MERQLKQVLTIVVGIALLPVIIDTIGTINATGTVKILLDLVPFVYVAGVVVLAFKFTK